MGMEKYEDCYDIIGFLGEKDIERDISIAEKYKPEHRYDSANTHTWLSPCREDGHHLVYESLYHLH